MNRRLSLSDVPNITVVVAEDIFTLIVAIETALVIKGVFNLSLRALEGFTNSVFQLMRVPLISPNYSCISKRAKTAEVKSRPPSYGRWLM